MVTSSSIAKWGVITGIYLGFQKGMVPCFKKELLLAKSHLPGRGNVFATHPKVKVILWGFFWTRLDFGHYMMVKNGKAHEGNTMRKIMEHHAKDHGK
jgi:hypothetical protein